MSDSTDTPLFDTISILIPGYSIEDLPTDLNEEQASGLLNAIAIAWHPLLLSRSRNIPSFRQAEASEMPRGPQIAIVPPVSEDWLGHDWKQGLAENSVTVLSGAVNRSEWLAAVEGRFPSEADPLDPDLIADFLALGTAHLLVVLLSRRLHHYVDPDEHLLESQVQAAAQALLAGDVDETRERLSAAFECLLNTREQFHPIDCFLLDLCLPAADTTCEALLTLIDGSSPVNLCCSAGELAGFLSGAAGTVIGNESAHESAPVSSSNSNTSVTGDAVPGECSRALNAALRAAIEDGRVSLLTGHRHELRTALSSLSTLYDDLRGGQLDLQRTLGHLPKHWARRKFGLVHSLPAVLDLFSFESALHVALDDGVYPDRERGQLLWQGPDGSHILSTSRIPVAIDSSSTFLRFADRYAESMQEDNSAVMLLARLPNVQTPWLDDLRRIEKYAAVLGRFVSFDEFTDVCRSEAGSVQFDAGEYLGPALIQSSVLKTEPPVSSPAALYNSRCRLEGAAAMNALTAILQPKDFQTDPRVDDLADALLEEEAHRSDTAGAAEADDRTEAMIGITQRLDELTIAVCQDVLQRLPQREEPIRGLCVFNSLPFSRQHTLLWPDGLQPPRRSESVTDAFDQNGGTALNLKLPAGGFVWLTEASEPAQQQPLQQIGNKDTPLAEDCLLRNKFFEALINESTGGIAEVRRHGKRGNRMSQQVGFRYEHSRSFDVDGETLTTSYAATKMISSTVRKAGPWFGELETVSDIVDPETGAELARCRQTMTVERNSPRLRIVIEFEDIRHEANGNPWMTYYAARFAWDNEAASITRSVLGQACGFRSERFESPDYVEVADSDQRLLIIPHGRPYHRRSGPRMLDSLLIAEGETSRRFEFTIDFDQPFPMRTASEVAQPPQAVPTTGIAPQPADSGWLLGLTAKNVTLARTRTEERDHGALDSDQDSATNCDGGARVVLLLEETEGLSTSCGIRPIRQPRAARLRRPDGSTIRDLTVSDSGVTVEFSAFQIKEVELTF